MTAQSRITVALAQLEQDIERPDVNLARALEHIERASRARADIVLFPEMHLQGYRGDERLAQTAEPVPGPSTDRLIEAARAHDIHIVMGMARRDEGFPHGVYNSACFVGPSGLIGCYDKIFLGTFHPFLEGVYFAPGDGTPVFDTPLGRASLQVCYDASFPELTRIYALKGAILNLVISAGPSAARESWSITLRQRAKENGMWTVYCNTVGQQKDFSFFGGSKIVDPRGRIVIEAKFDAEDFVVGEIDLAEAMLLRRQRLMFRDLKPRLFAELAELSAGGAGAIR
ncbi:MAG: carbon-nitrogen hydrolase family protein [Alphaproteobacteria bacterium]|nr:carbon-nitrogen hydrolase family protein [Alphaproteobacteria bacterium]